MMKNFFLALFVFVSKLGYAEVIFQPDAQKCRPFIGHFKFCKAEPKILPFPSVSNSQLKYLAALPVKAKLSINLYCPTTPDSRPVLLNAGDENILLATVSTPFVTTVEKTTTFSRIHEINFSFTPNLGNETTVRRQCLMETISNIAYPSEEFLRDLAEKLKSKYNRADELVEQIEKSSELPVSFALLREGNKKLATAIDSLQIEQNSLKKEIEVTSDEGTKTELQSLFDLYSSIIQDLEATASDLSSAIDAATPCSTSGETLCLKKLKELGVTLSSERDVAKSELSSLQNFLIAESSRLRSVSSDISKKLTGIAKELDLKE